jgi:hypothetical protein
MVPNVQPCAGGNGPASYGQAGAPAKSDKPATNMVAALQDWVENGRVPVTIIATRGVASLGQPSRGPARKRLRCAWPATSVLRPGSDPDKAESYSCKGAGRYGQTLNLRCSVHMLGQHWPSWLIGPKC